MKTGLWFKVSSERLETKYSMAYEASKSQKMIVQLRIFKELARNLVMTCDL